MRIEAISLLRLGRLEESVAAADRLLERYDGDQPEAVRRRVAGGSIAKIAALSKAGRHVEAEAAADRRSKASPPIRCTGRSGPT
jgi:hypothetical protein